MSPERIGGLKTLSAPTKLSPMGNQISPVGMMEACLMDKGEFTVNNLMSELGDLVRNIFEGGELGGQLDK